PAADHLEAVDLRHLDVEKHDVGLDRVERREHLAPVAALADDRKLGERREQLPHATARRGLVVGDQYAPCRLRAPASPSPVSRNGIRSRATVPPPPAAATVSDARSP